MKAEVDPALVAQTVATFEPCLEDGEEIRQWTSGWQRPPLWASLFFALLDSSGRSIMRYTQFYLVGVTDRRLLVLRYENKTMDFVEQQGPFRILEQHAWPLTALPQIKVKKGRRLSETSIEIDDSPKPLKMHLPPVTEAFVELLTVSREAATDVSPRAELTSDRDGRPREIAQ